MLDFTKLWDKTYLFGPNPADLSRSDLIFFWISLVFLTASVVAKIWVMKQAAGSPRKFLASRFFHLFLTIGLLVLIWVGLRFENIPWLGTHFVILLLLLIWFIWLVFIGKFFLKEFRSKQRTWEEEKIKRQYLP